jgi:drug/metabolite transporter (DMT)-like permease
MQISVHIALILVQILMASMAIVGKIVLQEVPASVLVMARVCGASVVLYLALQLAREPAVRDRGALLQFGLLGALGIAANQTLFLFGLGHTTAINATILVATIPVFTVIESLLSGREAPSLPKLAGIALAGGGVLYLIGVDRFSRAPDVAWGNILIVVAMVCYATYLVHSKRLLARHGVITLSFWVMTFGAVLVVPPGLYTLAHTSLQGVRPVVWVLTAYIVVGPTILAYLMNIWALKRVSSNLVAAYIYLQPILTAVVAPAVLAGEHLTSRALVGGLGIFIGLGLVIWTERTEAVEPMAEPLPGE